MVWCWSPSGTQSPVYRKKSSRTELPPPTPSIRPDVHVSARHSVGFREDTSSSPRSGHSYDIGEVRISYPHPFPIPWFPLPTSLAKPALPWERTGGHFTHTLERVSVLGDSSATLPHLTCGEPEAQSGQDFAGEHTAVLSYDNSCQQTFDLGLFLYRVLWPSSTCFTEEETEAQRHSMNQQRLPR